MRLVKILGCLIGAIVAFAVIAVAKAQSRYDSDQQWIRQTLREERKAERRAYRERHALTIEYQDRHRERRYYRDRWRGSPVRRHYYAAPTHSHYAHDRHDATRVYGVVVRRLDATGAVECYPNVEAWSVEANTEDGAWRDAQRNWENQVRAMYGERFMDISNSKPGGERQCWISSGNQSVAGRVAETVGRVVGAETVDGRKHRCRVMLQPCQAPKEANPFVKGEPR